MISQKIATCCYCGTRAALVLRGDKNHELSCASCGAPLHDLKMLPKARSKQHRDVVHTNAVRPKPKRPKFSRDDRRKYKKPKWKKSLIKKALSEVFDVIEDIFD